MALTMSEGARNLLREVGQFRKSGACSSLLARGCCSFALVGGGITLPAAIKVKSAVLQWERVLADGWWRLGHVRGRVLGPV